MKVFVDSNVLIYTKDAKSPAKRAAARAWLEALSARGAIVISRQSLREYYRVASSPKIGAPRESLRHDILALHAWLPPDGGGDRLEDAWAIESRHQFGFCDCLLLASALAAGCAVFLSEDLSEGQRIDALRVVNPFTTTPDAILGV